MNSNCYFLDSCFQIIFSPFQFSRFFATMMSYEILFDCLFFFSNLLCSNVVVFYAQSLQLDYVHNELKIHESLFKILYHRHWQWPIINCRRLPNLKLYQCPRDNRQKIILKNYLIIIYYISIIHKFSCVTHRTMSSNV